MHGTDIKLYFMLDHPFSFEKTSGPQGHDLAGSLPSHLNAYTDLNVFTLQGYPFLLLKKKH